MAAETGFLIDGTIYEVPSLMSLEMAEIELLYKASGCGLEDFVQGADEDDEDYERRVDKMIRQPGVMRSLMEIAYQRGNPTLRPERVAETIRRTNYMEAISTMSADDDGEPEDDPVPLALTPPPVEPSQSGSDESSSSSAATSETSGNDSTRDSDEPVDAPATTGIGKSDTSSISLQEISAA